MANWGKGNGELAWWEQAVGGSIAGAVFALVPQECALVLQECVRVSFLVVLDEEVGEGGKGELESKGVKNSGEEEVEMRLARASCRRYLFLLDCCYPALVPREQTAPQTV